MRRVLLVASVLLLFVAASPNRQSQSDAGVTVALDLGNAALVEGRQVEVGLSLKDANGAPISGVWPRVWFGTKGALDDRACAQKVAAFTAGGLFHQAAVDLNIFHVIALNSDATITVVDPRFSFGGSRLLGMTELAAPGADWALDADGSRLFVSMPKAGQIAVIETVDWRIVQSLAAGPGVARMKMQADGGYLWAAYDGGVVAIDPHGPKIAARLETGAGPHDLALSDDDAHLFVTNEADGTTSLVDVRTRKIVGKYATGAAPVSVAWAPRSKRAYVVSRDGAISWVDAKQHASKLAVKAPAGASRIRFSPAGRYGFVPNPERDVVYIFDTAVDRIVQTARVEKRPFEVTFSDTTAYVRHENSEIVLMLPLAATGTSGEPVQVSDFPGGEKPFGSDAVSMADGVIRAPGEHSILVANPADGNIYYYKEGMAAPMGHFSNYKHAPRALLVLDRSFREKAPGDFRTIARLPAAGKYDVAVAIDSPRVITCFQVAIGGDSQLTKRRQQYPVVVQQLTEKRLVKPGEAARLRFRLLDPDTRQPRVGLKDVGALIFRAPGTWHERVLLEAGENGDYTIDVVVPDEGTYYVYLESAAAGLGLNNHQYLVLKAEKGS